MSVKYKLRIKITTPKVSDATTDDRIWMEIYDAKKGWISLGQLNNSKDNFEVGTDTFYVSVNDLTRILYIRYKKSGSDGWYIGETEIWDSVLGTNYLFKKLGMLDNHNYTKRLPPYKISQNYNFRIQGQMDKPLSSGTKIHLKLFYNSGRTADVTDLITYSNRDHVIYFAERQFFDPFKTKRHVSDAQHFDDIKRVEIRSDIKSRQSLLINWIEVTDVSTKKAYAFSKISGDQFPQLTAGKKILFDQKSTNYDLVISTHGNATKNDVYVGFLSNTGKYQLPMQLISNSMSVNKTVTKELKLPIPLPFQGENKIQMSLAVGNQYNAKDSWSPVYLKLVNKQTNKEWIFLPNGVGIIPKNNMTVTSYGKIAYTLSLKSSEVSSVFNGVLGAQLSVKSKGGITFKLTERFQIGEESGILSKPNSISKFTFYAPDYINAISAIGIQVLDSQDNLYVDTINVTDQNTSLDFPFRKRLSNSGNMTVAENQQLVSHKLKLNFSPQRCSIGPDNFLMIQFVGSVKNGLSKKHGPFPIKSSSNGTIPIISTLLTEELSEITSVSMFTHRPLTDQKIKLDCMIELTNTVSNKMLTYQVRSVQFS